MGKGKDFAEAAASGSIQHKMCTFIREPDAALRKWKTRSATAVPLVAECALALIMPPAPRSCPRHATVALAASVSVLETG
jgi:hypothetical protein